MENDIEKNVFDFQDLPNTGEEIKPNFFIQNAIFNAQKVLTFSVQNGSNVAQGILAFSILIDNAESMSKAANYLTDEYYTLLKQFKESDEYKETKSMEAKRGKLANKKLELLMSEIFCRKTDLRPMKA